MYTYQEWAESLDPHCPWGSRLTEALLFLWLCPLEPGPLKSLRQKRAMKVWAPGLGWFSPEVGRPLLFTGNYGRSIWPKEAWAMWKGPYLVNKRYLCHDFPNIKCYVISEMIHYCVHGWELDPALLWSISFPWQLWLLDLLTILSQSFFSVK